MHVRSVSLSSECPCACREGSEATAYQSDCQHPPRARSASVPLGPRAVGSKVLVLLDAALRLLREAGCRETNAVSRTASPWPPCRDVWERARAPGRRTQTPLFCLFLAVPFPVPSSVSTSSNPDSSFHASLGVRGVPESEC